MVDGSQPTLDLATLPPLNRPYLDSSVFLAHIKEESIPCRGGLTRIEVTRDIFLAAERGQYKIHTSFFTLAEVRRVHWAPEQLRPEELPKINELFSKFFEHSWIIPIEVNRAVGEKAQKLGAIYNLSPQDAIHIASAIVAECDVLLAWDHDSFLKKLPITPTPGIWELEGVKILEPYWEGNRSLI